MVVVLGCIMLIPLVVLLAVGGNTTPLPPWHQQKKARRAETAINRLLLQ